MATSNKRTAAKQARYNYRLLKIERINQRLADGEADPLVPKFESIPDYDGLLCNTAQGHPLCIEVPAWEKLPISDTQQDEFELLLSYEGRLPYRQVDHEVIVGPITDVSFPRIYEIDAEEFKNDGKYYLYFHVARWNANELNSAVVSFTVDLTPPYGEGYPAILDAPVTTITQKYLDDNNNEWVCTLPGYDDLERGDRVAVYCEAELPDEPEKAKPVFGPVDVSGLSGRKMPISGEAIANKPDGLYHVSYVLMDKAGNVSRFSLSVKLDVELKPLPTDLHDPQVPLAADGLIDREDAFEGVEVEIPEFINPDKSVIEVTWGETLLDPLPLSSSSVFPVAVKVPWSTLKAEYAGAGGSGEVSTRVSYQVRRGSLLFPEAGPLSVDVDVDLSVIGPVNPDEPDPVNPALDLVVVRGEASQIDNKLTEDDHGKDATARMVLYTPVENGEILKLYWGEGEEPVDEHTIEGQKAGDEFCFTIPWDAIYESGNSCELPVYYTIEGQEANNFQRSASTNVQVSANTIELDAVTFPDIGHTNGPNPTEILNCKSLWGEEHAIRVQIPGNTRYLEARQTVELSWKGYSDYNGMDPVEASFFTITKVLTLEEATEGVMFMVQPYDKYILSIRDGSVRVSYTVKIDENTDPVPSAGALVMLSLTTGAGTCSFP